MSNVPPPRRSRSRILLEYPGVRQIEGESARRWFGSRRMELVVWYTERGEISGFQLCYDSNDDGRALTWMRGKGYAHNRIDGGEDVLGGSKMTPILLPDGIFERDRILEQFKQEGVKLPQDVADFVREKLEEFPA